VTPVWSDIGQNAERKRMTKVAQGRRGRHFTFIWNGAVISPFLVNAVGRQYPQWPRFHWAMEPINRPGHVKAKQVLLTISMMSSFRGIIILHWGPSLYLSPGRDDSLSAGPRSWPPVPGPHRALWSCVCLKTRLNPLKQLSQIRSQFSNGGGG